MTIMNENKIKTLEVEDLVSKSTPELIQLGEFYKEGIKNEIDYNPFKRFKKIIRKHWKKYIFTIILSIIIFIVSFCINIKGINFYYLIPAMVSMAYITFTFLILRDDRDYSNYINLDVIKSILEIRKNNKNLQSGWSEPKKIIDVYNILFEIKEANFTTLLKSMKNKNKSISDKTLRKILKEDLKELIGVKQGKFNSISRNQNNTKIYYIKK